MSKPQQVEGMSSAGCESNVLTLAATFPVCTLERYLEPWLRVIGSTHRIEVGPRGPVHRYLMDAEFRVRRPPRATCVLLFRLEDWNNFRGGAPHGDEMLPESRRLVERNLNLLIEAVDAAVDTCDDSLILILCPLSREHRQCRGIREYFRTLEYRLRDEIREGSRCIVLNADEILAGFGPEFGRYETEEFKDEGSPYSESFLERLARRIAQACYAIESRPWRGLVIAPNGPAGTVTDELKDFVALQWRCGRSVALAADCPADGCIIIGTASLPARRKIQQATRELLIPEHDLIFLGSAAECAEVERNSPRVLALPVFRNGGADTAALLRELWCLQPIPEFWSAEPDAGNPVLPRLSGRALLKLAANPDWPARAFLDDPGV